MCTAAGPQSAAPLPVGQLSRASLPGTAAHGYACVLESLAEMHRAGMQATAIDDYAPVVCEAVGTGPASADTER